MQCARWCFVQRKSEEFCIVVTLLAQPCPHDRWPCDPPQVVIVESLPLSHMLESLHLELISCSVRHRISKRFAKTKNFDETHKKCHEVSCGLSVQNISASRLTVHAVSTKQNWKRVCIVLCHQTVVRSNNGSRSFSFLHSAIRCCPPVPRPSALAAHLSRLVEIIGIHSCSCNLIVSHFGIFTWRFNGSMSSPSGARSVFRVFDGLACTLLCHTRFLAAQNCSQYWSLRTSLFCSDRSCRCSLRCRLE